MSVIVRKLNLHAPQIDKVWAALCLGVLLLFFMDQPQTLPSLVFTGEAFVGIAPFILVSILFAAYAKASGLDGQVARVFSGSPARSIMLAAVFGAFSPFCSCGVVPIIAGLLAAGVPLAPVMAFCIASPLMDPEMFVLMAGVFGVELTVAKTLAALFMGTLAGAITHLLSGAGFLSDPLRQATGCGSCCSSKKSALETEKIIWKFWTDKDRLESWRKTFIESGLFLSKWLALAFFIESLMLAYIPAEEIGKYLGSNAWWSVPVSVLAGIPAYLNGYAAIPTVNGLMELGMSPAAALAFMTGGGVTSIPAAMAVYALVKGRVFALYLLVGIGGAMSVSIAYAFYLSL